MQQKSIVHNLETYNDRIHHENLTRNALLPQKKRHAFPHQKRALVNLSITSAYQLLTLRGVERNRGAD